MITFKFTALESKQIHSSSKVVEMAREAERKRWREAKRREVNTFLLSIKSRWRLIEGSYK
jgi:hypothetical protein